MDPLATKVVEILTTELVKTGIMNLSTLAGQLLKVLRTRFSSNDKASEYLKDFEEDPNTYALPLIKEITNAIEADAEFKSTLLAILEEYKIPVTGATNIRSGSMQVTGKSNVVTQTTGVGNAVRVSARDYIENATIFGIPASLFTIIGAGVMLFGFFAMPWLSMFISLTGFEMANQFTGGIFSGGTFSPRSPSWQMYSFWIIPIIGAFGVLVGLNNLSSKKVYKNDWSFILVGSLISLYPFFYLYTDFSSGLSQGGLGGLTSSIIANGFWVSLVGNIVLTISALWMIFMSSRKTVDE